MYFIQENTGGYTLALLGGSHDGETVTITELMPVYKMPEKRRRRIRRYADYNVNIAEYYNIEGYVYVCWCLPIGDFTWEYHFFATPDVEALLREYSAAIYDYDISETYVRRQYTPDRYWEHEPPGNRVLTQWERQIGGRVNRSPLNHGIRCWIQQKIFARNMRTEEERRWNAIRKSTRAEIDV